jgi:hypothetical protein
LRESRRVMYSREDESSSGGGRKDCARVKVGGLRDDDDLALINIRGTEAREVCTFLGETMSSYWSPAAGKYSPAIRFRNLDDLNLRIPNEYCTQIVNSMLLL